MTMACPSGKGLGSNCRFICSGPTHLFCQTYILAVILSFSSGFPKFEDQFVKAKVLRMFCSSCMIGFVPTLNFYDVECSTAAETTVNFLFYICFKC